MSTLVSQLQLNKSVSADPSRKVAINAPFEWVRKGIEDFRSAPLLSLLYGALFAGICAAVYFTTRSAPWVTQPGTSTVRWSNSDTPNRTRFHSRMHYR